VKYRCEAQGVVGFVQQLATAYLVHGYHYYVTGCVPEKKDVLDVDARLIERYGVDLSRWQRARRKRAGYANVHYLRFGRFFVLLATRGQHQFFEEHPQKLIRDFRRLPLAFEGYSISVRLGVDRKLHASVRIHPGRYQEVKAYLLELAPRCNASHLEAVFRTLPFEPYAPVRQQLFQLLRAVNSERKRMGREEIPAVALRMKRRIVKPFGVLMELAGEPGNTVAKAALSRG